MNGQNYAYTPTPPKRRHGVYAHVIINKKHPTAATTISEGKWKRLTFS